MRSGVGCGQRQALVCAAALWLSACSGASGSAPEAGGGSAGAAGQVGAVTAGAGGSSGAAGVGNSGAAGATGGSGGSSTVAGSKLEACLDYVKQFCAFNARCRGDLEGSRCEAPSAAACPDLLFAEGSTRTIDGVVACARTWSTFSCDDYLAGGQPACVTPGTKAEDEACSFASQCAGLNCSDQLGCGVCLPDVAPGGACDSRFRCPGGQFCDAGTCQNGMSYEGRAGAACDAEHGCYKLADCVAGVCTVPPLPGAGEPCLIRPGLVVCGLNVACDGTTCQPLRVSGEACGGPPALPCAQGLSCRVQPDSSSICQPRGGADCASDGDCLDGQQCVQQRCLAAAGFHEPCDETHVCASSFASCQAGNCAPLETRGIYEACSP